MRLLLILSLLALAACGTGETFDPWGKASKANCDRYGNDCKPLCSQYGNCDVKTEPAKSCDLYGNCGSGSAPVKSCDLYGNCD